MAPDSIIKSDRAAVEHGRALSSKLSIILGAQSQDPAEAGSHEGRFSLLYLIRSATPQ